VIPLPNHIPNTIKLCWYGHYHVHPCPSKWPFLTLPGARRMPLKSPVFRRWTLILASLTTYAQTTKVMDMDIDFFDHYHWLPAPRPTHNRHPLPRTLLRISNHKNALIWTHQETYGACWVTYAIRTKSIYFL